MKVISLIVSIIITIFASEYFNMTSPEAFITGMILGGLSQL